MSKDALPPSKSASLLTSSNQGNVRSKIVLLGDSITQLSFSATLCGWGAHLSDVYQRRADIYNRGFSGYNTDWFLKYLETEEGRKDIWGIRNGDSEVGDDVKLITIFFGANDASDPVLNPRHHVPVPRFQSNLRKIVSLCREHYGKHLRILFISPPPVHHASRLQYQIQRYGKEKATGKLERTLALSGKYTEAVKVVADELGLPFLNLWEKMQDCIPSDSKEEKWSIYLSDGLHLSREGNLLVGTLIVDAIEKYYPDLNVTPCPHTGYTGNSSSQGGVAFGSNGGAGPWHDEIDYQDVEKIFQQRMKKRKISKSKNC